MISRKQTALFLTAFMTLAGAAADVITNLSSLAEACQSHTNLNRRFSVSGRLLAYYMRPEVHEWVFNIGRDARAITVYEFNGSGRRAVNIPRPRLDDFIELTGVLYAYQGKLYPGYTEARVLKPAAPGIPGIRCDSPDELFRTARPDRLMSIAGTIRDFFRDESDPNYIHLTMTCHEKTLQVMVLQVPPDVVDPSRYVGMPATVTGTAAEKNDGLRRHLGRHLAVSGIESVVLAGRDNPTNVYADLDSVVSSGLSPLASAGLIQAEGDVLCTWQRNHVLVKTVAGNIAKVKLLDPTFPRVGDKIRIRGIPETDLYFLNLVNATWESVGSAGPAPRLNDELSPRNLLFNDAGYPMIKVGEHGQTLRFSGVVRHLPRPSASEYRFHLESDGYLVPIDVGGNENILEDLVVGSKVSVTGICVLDIDSYGIGTSIPQARGFFLVLRTPDDLVVLERPPWWTPLRLLIVIGGLILALIAIILWNLALKRLAERRGKELAAEQVGRVTSDLKVYERTHLAVELHDSLSQTLSGVSMQIDAVRRFAATDPTQMNKHIDIAAQTLKSCRDELRNCLLDLRSNALEENDMNAAIRQTLEPYLSDADITIRFAVPREILSDNTAHTIFRIIRELVVNALRHGHAAKIRVAGSVEDNKILFSVRDDGCGFSTETAPGIAEGHFGLQGIRERIEELEGEFTIDSQPGKSTKATVAIRLPNPTGDKNG